MSGDRPRLVPPDDPTNDDAILEAYLEWVDAIGLELYEAQEEAVLEVMAGRHVILNTPTGSGKSMVAIAALYRALCKGQHGYYTSPIKALVSEKFFDMCKIFGAEHVGMATGDASVNKGAAITCCTAEIVANIGLRDGAKAPVDVVVMDEFHYFADRERGMAWQLPLLTLPGAIYLLMSATLGDVSRFEREIPEFTGTDLVVVKSAQRPVPLEFTYVDTPLHETISTLVEQDRAPVYIVNFTQREAAKLAQDLVSMNLVDKEGRKRINAALGGFKFDSSYGKDLQRFLKAGVGLHHAGLLPKYRLLVERLAQQGMLRVVCGTDTLGVGVNIPLRTVLFTKLCKYDGESTKILTVRDFKQIAGRAGRKGHDDRGWVVAQAPEHVIENKRLEAKAAASGKKKFTRRKPPDRGYVHWDESTFRKLVDGEPEELIANFRVDHGMILNLLQRIQSASGTGGGYRDLVRLVQAAVSSPARRRRHLKDAAVLFRALRAAGIVVLTPRGGGAGRDVHVDHELDEDFSVFHALALFLFDALDGLNPESPEHGLDVVTLAEAICENPRAVLIAQEKKAKDDRMAEMKAAGMEYEERMNELDKVTYPKPQSDFIYGRFNQFAAAHPWVGREAIRPKSVARDMLEKFASFNEYVKGYGLSRAEGIVLRYLNEVYKVLKHTLPERAKTEAVVEATAWLRATIERVDASLLQEWERMMNPGAEVEDAPLPEVPVEEDISADRRSFLARIRAEVHRFVRALSVQDWEEAAASVRDAPDDEGEAWSAARIESALADFQDEHGAVRFDHAARTTDKTRVQETADHLWTVQQTLADPEDTGLWFVEAEVDLREDRSPTGPLLRLRRVST